MHWTHQPHQPMPEGYLSAQGWRQELINILNGSGDACPVEVDREGKRDSEEKRL